MPLLISTGKREKAKLQNFMGQSKCFDENLMKVKLKHKHCVEDANRMNTKTRQRFVVCLKGAHIQCFYEADPNALYPYLDRERGIG